MKEEMEQLPPSSSKSHSSFFLHSSLYSPLSTSLSPLQSSLQSSLFTPQSPVLPLSSPSLVSHPLSNLTSLLSPHPTNLSLFLHLPPSPSPPPCSLSFSSFYILHKIKSHCEQQKKKRKYNSKRNFLIISSHFQFYCPPTVPPSLHPLFKICCFFCCDFARVVGTGKLRDTTTTTAKALGRHLHNANFAGQRCVSVCVWCGGRGPVAPSGILTFLLMGQTSNYTHTNTHTHTLLGWHCIELQTQIQYEREREREGEREEDRQTQLQIQLLIWPRGLLKGSIYLSPSHYDFLSLSHMLHFNSAPVGLGPEKRSLLSHNK